MTLCNQKCAHRLIKKNNGREVRNSKGLYRDDLQSFTLYLIDPQNTLQGQEVHYFYSHFIEEEIEAR